MPGGPKRQRQMNPWERGHDYDHKYQFSEEENYYFDHLIDKWPKFSLKGQNVVLDLDTKRAALMTDPSIVTLMSFSGEEELSHASGTIIESAKDNWVTVLTSTRLIRRPSGTENTLADNLKINVRASDGESYKGEILVFDFHYNIMAIKFQSHSPLPAATMRQINQSLTLNPRVPKEKPFQLRPHSFGLVPGDPVIAVGRYIATPFELMAAPGCFSLYRCEHDCQELFMVTCNITRCGDGGPLINLSGEVIGITFYEPGAYSYALPMNIVCKWWYHYKSSGELRHPSLGFEATNFYAADLGMASIIIRRFPDICKGVLVEKVILGSSAHSAGLRQDDVIIQCGGKTVDSFLELWEIMWDMVGETVELIVARVEHNDLIHLNMMVAQVTPNEFNSWPLQNFPC